MKMRQTILEGVSADKDCFKFSQHILQNKSTVPVHVQNFPLVRLPYIPSSFNFPVFPLLDGSTVRQREAQTLSLSYSYGGRIGTKARLPA